MIKKLNEYSYESPKSTASTMQYKIKCIRAILKPRKSLQNKDYGKTGKLHMRTTF